MEQAGRVEDQLSSARAPIDLADDLAAARLLTAQTAALDAQRALLQVRSRRLAIAIDTVRALGGDRGS